MLHYTISGNGKTIILIHGFCENSTCFHKQVLLLKEHYTILAIDLPGHGKSPVIPEFSMEQLAGEIKQVLDKEKVNNCILIGHSMGGYATLAFAKKYGSMLSGFGLFHSTAAPDNEDRKAKRDQAVKVISEKGAEAYITGFVPPMFAAATANEIVHQRLEENKHIPPGALISCLLAMKERPDSRPFLTETTLPVLFVAGKQDSLIPEKDIIAQAASCRQAQLVYLLQSGHMGMIEEPGKAGEGLKAFADYCFREK